MTEWLASEFPGQSLYFYDAIAPIVAAESVDMKKAFFGSRFKPGENDYCNCPLTEEEYAKFYDALVSAETVHMRAFEEERYFEACLPLEIIAKRGRDAMAFGPLKPIGFTNPGTGRMPFALCQLRRENAAGGSFSLVACQTRLTQGEQKRVFGMIPGLEHAEFLRYGTCHRNTYINSPELLLPDLSFKKMPQCYCAGQLCGNEGYVESIATGHLAALFVHSKICGTKIDAPPQTTALGSLLRYVKGSGTRPFAPTSFHFGLLPAIETVIRRKIPKKEKHMLLCNRAIEDFKIWVKSAGV
jgi:methylenetetrahydrofolate--tRNA-(uracil-5-)-methyltransferase